MMDIGLPTANPLQEACEMSVDCSRQPEIPDCTAKDQYGEDDGEFSDIEPSESHKMSTPPTPVPHVVPSLTSTMYHILVALQQQHEPPSTISPNIGTSSIFELNLSWDKKYQLVEHDYGSLLAPFLAHLPQPLAESVEAAESNRSLLIHLALAVGINPFTLVCYYRHHAFRLLQDMVAKDEGKAVSSAEQQRRQPLYDLLTPHNHLVPLILTMQLDLFRHTCIHIISSSGLTLGITSYLSGTANDITNIILRYNNTTGHYTLLNPHPDEVSPERYSQWSVNFIESIHANAKQRSGGKLYSVRIELNDAGCLLTNADTSVVLKDALVFVGAAAGAS